MTNDYVSANPLTICYIPAVENGDGPP